MMQSLFSARLGLAAQQKRVDTIAHNLANINTHGYKGESVRFKDALYTTMQRPAEPYTGNNLQLGTGVLVSSVATNHNNGTPSETGVSLDFYLEGDGFFTVEDATGNIQYTRNGSFAISDETGARFLVNHQGNYVLDDRMQRIAIPASDHDLVVNEEGALSMGDGAPFARFNIVSFPYKDGLQPIGETSFLATGAAGEATAFSGKVRQGFLEESNVDLMAEVTRLIRAQRAFSLAGRAVTALDEMQGTANNIR